METTLKVAPRQASLRRYDIDWLRVIAFGLLIFFHISIFFSPWGWFLKNNVINYTINYPMMFLSQWRMPLLFMISGAGVYWSLGKRSAETFMGDRIRRILLPLVFGMLVVVPPQIYVERLVQGHTYTYAEFYRHVLTFQFYPKGDFGWHHLWYLGYIFLYSLLGLPLWLLLKKPGGQRFSKQLAQVLSHPFLLIALPVAWLLLADLLNLPENERNLSNDWKTHFRYFTLFACGYVLCNQPQFWHTISRYRVFLLGLASGLTLVLLIFYWRNWHEFKGLEAIGFTVFRTANYWVWLLAIFSYGHRFLNFNNSFLKYASQAVYPYYILHQTLIVIGNYFLASLDWAWQLKFLLLVVTTFGGCFLIYHFLIRPFRLIRPFFGAR